MLEFKPFEGSAEFTFIDPDTNYHYSADSFTSLVSFIVNYRAQNRLKPIVGLGQVINNYLCGLPCNSGKCRQAKLKRGFYQYVKGGIALLENLYFGEEHMVPQEEADRRALICLECKFNVIVDKGPFIRWSDDLALACVGNRKSTYHDALGNCEGCSCCLRAKVFFKGPFKLSKKEVSEMRAANGKCWQLEEIKNG